MTGALTGALSVINMSLIIFIITTLSGDIFSNGDTNFSKNENGTEIYIQQEMPMKFSEDMLNISMEQGDIKLLRSTLHKQELGSFDVRNASASVNIPLVTQCDVQQSIVAEEIYVREEYGTLEYILQESISCPLELHWRIIAPESSVLNLTFTYFRLRHCSDNCLCDNLTIYDTKYNTSERRGQHCGVREPWFILSKWNIVELRLKVYNVLDSFYQLESKYDNPFFRKRHYDELTGFSLLYQLKPANQFLYITPVPEVTLPSGQLKITKPHIMISGVKIHHWHIRVEEDRFIDLSYDVQGCFGNNKVSFHDGPTEMHLPIKEDVKIRSVQSTGFHLYVVLKIQSGNQPCVSFKYISKEIVSGKECEKYQDLHVIYADVALPYIGKFQCALSSIGLYINGPNHDNCAYQGVILWHGQNRTKIGPFCGIDQHKEFLYYTSKLNIPNMKVTALVYIYDYMYSGDKGYVVLSMSHIREHSVFCSFIFNVDSIDHHVDFKTTKTKNNTLIKIHPKDNWCLIFYFVPSEKPINQNVEIAVLGVEARNIFLANNIKSLQASTGCQINTGITEDFKENLVTLHYHIDCPYTPVGLRLYLNNVNVCEARPTVRRTGSSIEGLAYGDKLCGQPDNTRDDIIYIQGLNIEVYYLFKITCRASLPCLDTNMEWKYEYSIFYMTLQVVQYSIKILPVVLSIPGWSGVHIKFKLDPKYTLTYERKLYPSNVTNTPSLQVFDSWYWLKHAIKPVGHLREILYQDHLYSVCWSKEILSWEDAYNFCNSYGSDLLYINSKTEYNFIRRFLALAEAGLHFLSGMKSMSYFLNMKVSEN